jgi:aminotransferase in exopolysaccharide biosynthesis
MVADFTGVKHAIATVNGTAALHIALLLSGVKRLDEVITQPLTFVATANAITYVGAKPVFIDVDKDTMGLSPEKLLQFLKHTTIQKQNPITKKLETINKKTGKRIAACIPMHTFGHAARIDEINEICNSYHITLIEDAAESLGSYFKGQHTGTFGLFGTLSFNGNKTITTGGGGMLLTNDAALAKKAKEITTTAKVPHQWEYVHDRIAYNYRLTNLAAALGVAQMEQLPEIIKNKKKLAETYQTFFLKDSTKFVTEPTNSTSNYWLNAIVLEDRKERDAFLEYTNKHGVMTRPIWELMNRLEMFKNCQVEDISNAEWLVDRVVNIPSSIL